MVVEGVKGVLELLRSSLVTKRIYVTTGSKYPELTRVASDSGIEVSTVSSKDMDIMSSLKKAPGVLAVGEISYSTEENLILRVKTPCDGVVPTLLLLDDLVDPGNVGALIRTADWFGLAGVVCSPRTADVWNTKAIQSSMGSLFRLPILVQDLGEFISNNNLSCAALDAGGEDIYTNSDIPNAVVVGSESQGLSEGLKNICDIVLAIPGSGNAESLNAAIAGSILSSEISRRWRNLNR
tara:strand:+ start:1399 stop:2112 length:714 start_codon:yes stop_codon:yes gene_type:complete